MKKIGLYFSVVTMIMLVWTGCEKEKTILPPREISEDVQVMADRYRQILVENDWFLAYKPENLEDSVYLKLSFSDGELVNILSGYRGYHETQTGTEYDFEGKYTPVIIFSDNTVFGALASQHNGSVKFKIKYVESEGYFELVRSDGYDDAVFRLVKLTPANEEKLTDQVDEILAQIAYEEEQARLSEEVRQKVKAFAEIESNFYFYNLTVDDFSAAIHSFDTTARAISLTYKETPTSEPATVTVGYTLTPDGMVLNPAITYGNVSVDVIKFGDLIYEDTDSPTEPTAIEVTSAGNAGAGKMGYMHVAPYSYTRSTDRSQTLVNYFLNEYTSSVESSGRFGPKASVYMEDFREYIRSLPDFNPSGRHVYIIYSPNYTTTNLRDLFWVGSSRRINSSSSYANMGFNLRVVMQNLDANKMNINEIVQQTNVSVSNNIPDISSRAQEYLDQIAPSNGVTMVPYDMANEGSSGYRVRLVSTVDSRVWVEYRWPSATYFNMIFN